MTESRGTPNGDAGGSDAIEPDWPPPAYGEELLTNTPAGAAYGLGRVCSRLLAHAGLRPVVGPWYWNHLGEVLPEEVGPHGTLTDPQVPHWFRAQHRWLGVCFKAAFDGQVLTRAEDRLRRLTDNLAAAARDGETERAAELRAEALNPSDEFAR